MENTHIWDIKITVISKGLFNAWLLLHMLLGIYIYIPPPPPTHTLTHTCIPIIFHDCKMLSWPPPPPPPPPPPHTHTHVSIYIKYCRTAITCVLGGFMTPPLPHTLMITRTHSHQLLQHCSYTYCAALRSTNVTDTPLPHTHMLTPMIDCSHLWRLLLDRLCVKHLIIARWQLHLSGYSWGYDLYPSPPSLHAPQLNQGQVIHSPLALLLHPLPHTHTHCIQSIMQAQRTSHVKVH